LDKPVVYVSVIECDPLNITISRLNLII
jgi:hypothetical protein